MRRPAQPATRSLAGQDVITTDGYLPTWAGTGPTLVIPVDPGRRARNKRGTGATARQTDPQCRVQFQIADDQGADQRLAK